MLEQHEGRFYAVRRDVDVLLVGVNIDTPFLALNREPHIIDRISPASGKYP